MAPARPSAHPQLHDHSAVPPTATTQAATAITATTATLNASVNPEGSATTVTFVYGTDSTLDDRHDDDHRPVDRQRDQPRRR